MGNRQEILLGLVERSGPRLYGLLTKLTLHEDVVDELFQEVFSRLGSSERLEKITNIDAYACRMAINLAFDWRRRQKRAPLPITETAEPASVERSVLDELIHDEDVEIILNGIEQLQGLSKEAVILKYIEQESYDEIASKIGKNEHQVRGLCSKGIRRLREILDREHY